ncbi:MAG: hypothetical protein MUD17_12475 [Gemmatimonadaceae bacterium]|nr:hypothetical protein [Gemmatimonadaceae bacterium]
MFSTCCFCHASLGTNDAIEHFPVGRRLAFDGERGRLWAVCPRCARWNLAPIEERWEALEECEKAYRTATKRVSTDNIALARLRDGTDLVRIGRPLLPEFAAWRYSREFLRRAYFAAARRSIPFATINGAGLFAASRLLGPESGAYLIAMPGVAVASIFGAGGYLLWRQRQPTALVFEQEGALYGVSQANIGATRITHDALHGLTLRVTAQLVRPTHRLNRALGVRVVPRPGEAPSERSVHADDAYAVLPRILAATNALEATGRLVQEAVERIERTPVAPLGTPRAIAVLAPRIAGYRESLFGNGEAISHLSPVHRLAAEMALHEDDERRALAGRRRSRPRESPMGF